MPRSWSTSKYHHAVELLPGCTIATIHSWLASHPGVKVVCRNRSDSYAEAVRLGTPDAVQVADRFHLWQNFADAMEKTVLQQRALLPEPSPAAEPAPAVALAGHQLRCPAGPVGCPTGSANTAPCHPRAHRGRIQPARRRPTTGLGLLGMVSPRRRRVGRTKSIGERIIGETPTIGTR